MRVIKCDLRVRDDEAMGGLMGQGYAARTAKSDDLAPGKV